MKGKTIIVAALALAAVGVVLYLRRTKVQRAVAAEKAADIAPASTMSAMPIDLDIGEPVLKAE